MSVHRRLVVNADDFGQTIAVTRGIIDAHARGIVTSTSLMVRGDATAEAAAASARHPALGVGLHLDLGEWMRRDGEWVALYEVVPLDDATAVTAEVERQVQAFVDLLGRPPTHLDSHQHVHQTDPVRTAAVDMGKRLGIPVRHFAPGITYCGDFYGQCADGTPWPSGITPEHLVDLLGRLAGGTTELACHPGFGAGSATMYDRERQIELDALCDPRVRDAVRAGGIALVTFADLPVPPREGTRPSSP